MSSRPNTARVSGAVSDGAWIRSRQPSATIEPSRVSRLLAEARWIAGAALAAALLAVLLTYSREDPGFTHSVAAAPIHNLGGRLGAWIADVVLLVFGISAYLVALGLAVTVARAFRRLHRVAAGADPLADDLPAWAHGLGFGFLMAGATGLEALRLYNLKAALPGLPGGIVGNAIASLVQSGVGFTGASVIFLVAIAVGLSLFLDFSWLSVAERVGTFIEGFSRRAEQRREEAEDRAIGEAATKVREAALAEERERIEEAPPVHIERLPAHVKPSERKQKEKQVPLFAEMADARLPALDLLDEPPPAIESVSTETLEFTSRLIEKKLRDFNV
ncbi:MAG: DNA translocase FtsK 4TM domain-containing protein, partial [Betaproteobacteria bacterium]